MAGKRNRHGVNDSCQCYRTIGGCQYIAWISCPSDERIAAYRSAGVRCRRQGVELYVCVADEEDAQLVDATWECGK